MASTVDPRDNRRMYLAAWGQERPDVDTGGGDIPFHRCGRNLDGRYSTTPSTSTMSRWTRVNPEVLYTCGFDAAACRSTDARTRHWTRIKGYNFKWGHSVVADPNDRAKIYVTTYGGSVWHGPAAGDPDALEDIVTPVPVAH